MMKEKKLSHSVRKFIRGEKNRIRSKFSDVKKQEELIGELYKKAIASAESKQEKLNKKNDAKSKDKEVKKEVSKVEEKKEKKVKAK